jgi:hypothetical protein
MTTDTKLQIEYHFILPNSKHVSFNFTFNRITMLIDNQYPEDLPAWTKLDYHQCSHCPLSTAEHSHCPLATQLVSIIEPFNEAMSYDTVQVEVLTERRKISKTTAVQEALSAVLGLVIPTSGCPQTAFFRPMARFHLPLADTAETIYRATSMYLLAQYFKKKNGKEGELDFSGLEIIYQNMQILNASIAQRLRDSTQTDSSVNALVLLDVFAQSLPFALKESLEELELLFSQYFV